MPIHIAPALVQRELNLESQGLIVPLNSDGYIQVVKAQAAGLLPVIQIPVSKK